MRRDADGRGQITTNFQGSGRGRPLYTGLLVIRYIIGRRQIHISLQWHILGRVADLHRIFARVRMPVFPGFRNK